MHLLFSDAMSDTDLATDASRVRRTAARSSATRATGRSLVKAIAILQVSADESVVRCLVLTWRIIIIEQSLSETSEH